MDSLNLQLAEADTLQGTQELAPIKAVVGNAVRVIVERSIFLFKIGDRQIAAGNTRRTAKKYPAAGGGLRGQGKEVVREEGSGSLARLPQRAFDGLESTLMCL